MRRQQTLRRCQSRCPHSRARPRHTKGGAVEVGNAAFFLGPLSPKYGSLPRHFSKDKFVFWFGMFAEWALLPSLLATASASASAPISCNISGGWHVGGHGHWACRMLYHRFVHHVEPGIWANNIWAAALRGAEQYHGKTTPPPLLVAPPSYAKPLLLGAVTFPPNS